MVFYAASGITLIRANQDRDPLNLSASFLRPGVPLSVI